MTSQLREASAALSPKIKAVAPKAIFDRNAILNSVLTLWWAQTEGSKIALLPYKALGYLKNGEELFSDYRSIPIDSSDRFTKVVDMWADRLELKGCYNWRYRKA